MIDYRVYLVTDDPSRYRGDWLENIAAAVAGGVTCVQYRDTQSTGRVAYERCRALRDLLRARGVPLVVNNDVALALAVGAQGVHVGQDDLPPEAVRAVAGKKLEIGLSVTCAGDWKTVDRSVVDCVGVGPVFDARKTKADAAPEMGLAGLKEILEFAEDMPNVAIGGISLERAPAVVRAGAGGVAVVSAISQAADPEAAARFLRNLF